MGALRGIVSLGDLDRYLEAIPLEGNQLSEMVSLSIDRIKQQPAGSQLAGMVALRWATFTVMTPVRSLEHAYAIERLDLQTRLRRTTWPKSLDSSAIPLNSRIEFPRSCLGLLEYDRVFNICHSDVKRVLKEILKGSKFEIALTMLIYCNFDALRPVIDAFSNGTLQWDTFSNSKLYELHILEGDVLNAHSLLLLMTTRRVYDWIFLVATSAPKDQIKLLRLLTTDTPEERQQLFKQSPEVLEPFMKCVEALLGNKNPYSYTADQFHALARRMEEAFHPVWEVLRDISSSDWDTELSNPLLDELRDLIIQGGDSIF
jgi:hypothetical protein